MGVRRVGVRGCAQASVCRGVSMGVQGCGWGGVGRRAMARVGGHGCVCEGVSGRARACVRGRVHISIHIQGQRVWVWACLGVHVCIVVVLREGVARGVTDRQT